MNWFMKHKESIHVEIKEIIEVHESIHICCNMPKIVFNANDMILLMYGWN